MPFAQIARMPQISAWKGIMHVEPAAVSELAHQALG